jgi:hypothetical protein
VKDGKTAIGSYKMLKTTIDEEETLSHGRTLKHFFS